MGSLAGTVSIVTGAGRGIGKAISLALARAGSRVVLAARSEPQLRDVAEEIRSLGGEALVVPTDLTRDEEMESLVGRALKEWGSIDHLINNAGWGKTGPIVKAKREEWDRTLRVNLRAAMVLSQLVLPQLMEKGRGAIVNISSVSGRSGHANTAAYSASKFGLIGFTESLYEEVREYGIKAAVILPGFVDTPMIPPTRSLDRSKMIRPEDIAEAVLFVLTSSETSCPVEITIRPQKTPYK
ncbi:MAG TPA: SDR family oxidoreductase [Candidatus Binatia bacterium]|jgi:NAD(P)-dependent dehydrogenase (short-subunit alcohol dehydrogenase family)|nr:SDR family oxidoreductase [Candidatus Binatia bacterium]